jgi:hypothetical protein
MQAARRVVGLAAHYPKITASAFGHQGINLLEHLFHAPANFLALFF